MADSKSAYAKDSEVDLARQILAELRKQLDAAAAGLDAGGPDSARAVGRLTGLANLKDRSVDAYTQAVRLDPSASRSRAGLVLALLKADRHDDALEQATILAGQDPAFQIGTLLPGESVSALALLGDALATLSKLDAAEQAYRSVLEKSPKDSYASGRLSQLLLQTAGRSTSAVEEAVRLGKNTEQNPRFDQLRGVLRLAASESGIVPSLGSVVPVMGPVPGRPFVVNGERRRATVETGSGWKTALAPDLSRLDQGQLAKLGEYWAGMGREEHAGVGSFARFVLQLLALGAPADLVQEATRAMNDEIEHAKLCFGVASAALGRAVGVGALEIENCLEGSSDPWTILQATVVEGCVGETSSAAIAARARGRCTDACIATVLDRIVADESRHADLAWKFSEWVLETHPDLAEGVAAVFASAAAANVASSEPSSDEAWDPALDTFGAVSPSASEREARAAFKDDVMTRCHALLQAVALAPVGSVA